MLLVLLIAAIFVGVQSTVISYDPFPRSTPLNDIDNEIDQEPFIERSMQPNSVLQCDIHYIVENIGLSDLHEIIESLALKNGISSFSVLRKLYKRIKNKETDGNEKHGTELLITPTMVHRISPHDTAALPTKTMEDFHEDDDTDVVIVPMGKPNSVANDVVLLSPIIKNDRKNKYPEIKSNKKINRLPLVRYGPVIPPFPHFPGIANHGFKPPAGANIRINTGIPESPIDRDMTITLSPLMSLVDTLRQIEIKLQHVLGLKPDTEVISFSRHLGDDCYVLSHISDVLRNDAFGWKVTITDREGKIVHDDFCLPSGKSSFVKPGSSIVLSYVPL